MKNVTKWIVLLGIFMTAPVTAQEATQADFQKWCSLVEGRWVGTIKWLTSWPGFGKQGEQVTAYWQGRVSADGKVMFTKFLGGAGSDHGLIYYDSVAKRIRTTHIGSGGAVFQSILWPVGDQWREEVNVALPDGTRGQIKSVFVYSDDGRQLTIQSDSEIGKDVVKEQKDVWRRVSNPRPAVDAKVADAPAVDAEEAVRAAETRPRRSILRRLQGVLRRRRP